jgi:hypothetical protein
MFSNLAKLDLFSQSDPIIVLFIPQNGILVEVGRTEIIWNDPNPKFVKFFQIMHILEIDQPLLFKVYDVDLENDSIENFTLISSVQTNVQTLVSHQEDQQFFQLKNEKLNKDPGKLILILQRPQANHQQLSLNCAVLKMKKIDLITKNSPFLFFSKPHESGTVIPVFKSNVCQGVTTCIFQPIKIPISLLCNGDFNCPITITLKNFQESSASQIIGSESFSVNSLLDSGNQDISLKNNSHEVTATIRFTEVQVWKIQKQFLLIYCEMVSKSI